MPELPEVEVTRRSLLPRLTGQRVTSVVVRNPALRYPVAPDIAAFVVGGTLRDIQRRAKYLLLDFGRGVLLIHLGMSGSLRLVPTDTPAGTHDHVDLQFEQVVLRFHDPRRFGAVIWMHSGDRPHKLLEQLGVEPLSEGFTAEFLHRVTRERRAAVKQVLMDSHVIAGVGNIYASESLFRAGVRPAVAARRLSRAQCGRLVAAIRSTLEDALAAGGSTLRDFVASDGRPGYFQQQYFVYGRTGEPCRRCGTPIRQLRLGQRSTFHCPTCQR
jgi:formamidopyrimidine-DNA glycosylase